MRLFGDRVRYTSLQIPESPEEKPFDESLEGGDTVSRSSLRRESRRWWPLHVILGLCWIAAFSLLFLVKLSNSSPDRSSPLSSTLKYSPHRFSTGLDTDKTPYQGEPSSSNEAAWNHLTNIGIVALTASEHTKLPEPSVLFNSTTQTYIGAIEVFHQLHCLDMLRLEMYNDLDDWLLKHHSKKDKMEHLDHCVDFLRQSLMCRPSVEILPFKMDDSGNFKARFDGVHTCANFEAVRDWAVERQAGDLTPQ